MSTFIQVSNEQETVVVVVAQEGPQGPRGSGSGNETILFTNVATVVVMWNSTRIANFGASANFYVEIIGDDGLARWTPVEIIPDSIITTTQYTINLGGISSGRITIS